MIKVVSYFSADFERAFVSDEQSEPLFEKKLIYIPAKVEEIDLTTNISDYSQSEYVKRKVEEVMVEGSGFTLSRIHKLTVQCVHFRI